MVHTSHTQKSLEEIVKTPQFMLKSFENSRRNNEMSTWTVMDRSEKLRRKNECDRQRTAQETDEQREARSVQIKKTIIMRPYVDLQDCPLYIMNHVYCHRSGSPHNA